MASNDKPVFFISSSMSELEEERQIVRKAVAKLADGSFETFCFEEDAVAQTGSPQDVWREQLDRTDTTLGLLYQKMGQYTEEELRISRERGIPILLFRKKDKDKVLERDAADFMAWLENAEDGITAKYFKTPKELKKHVKAALARQLKEMYSVARGARRAGTLSVDGTELVESAPPPIGRRTEPPQQLGKQRVLVGRDSEILRLLGFIERARDADKRHIALVGPDGIGKRAVLRYLTHSDQLPAFRDGTAVHPNWKEREDLEDLRQALWQEFYDTQNVVDPRGRDRQLREIEALVFLPAVDGSADIDDVVAETMPRSVFCTSRTELSTPVMPVKVAGLTEGDEMLAVFEALYGPVPDAARTPVLQLLASTEGNPGKIELLATDALMEAPDDGDPTDQHPLVAWATGAAPGTGVTPDEAKLLNAASGVGNVHTPREVLANVVGSGEVVDLALQRRRLRAASPRYRLNPVLQPHDREPKIAEADDGVMAEVFKSTLRWVDQAPHAEIFANRSFVLRMMSWGCEQERWSEVINLGRRAEPALAMGGRHGAWRELLEGVATAAKQLDPPDQVASSWAAHQLGVRALLRDDLDEGRTHLFTSFRLRQGDDEARSLTRRNLKLLPAAVVPTHVLVLVPLFLVLIVLALLQTDELEPDVDIDFGTVAIPANVVAEASTDEFEHWVAAEDADRITVSISDSTINDSEVSVQDAGLCLVVDGRCIEDARVTDGAISASGTRLCPSVDGDGTRRSVSSDEPCVIVVGFTPTTIGRVEATLRIEADDGSVLEGDLTATAVAAVVEANPDYWEFAAVDEVRSFTIANVGSTTVEIVDSAVEPISTGVDEEISAFDVDSDCQGRLEPRDTCSVTVRAVEYGSGFLRFTITSVDDVQVIGDSSILLAYPPPEDSE